MPVIILLHLLYQVPAMFVFAPALRNLLPFELDIKLVPIFLVLCCLGVLYLPLTLTLALAAVWPVMVLHKFFGVSLHTVVPFEVPEFLKELPSKLPFPHRMQHIVYDSHEVPDQAEPDTRDLAAEQETKRKSFIPDLP